MLQKRQLVWTGVSKLLSRTTEWRDIGSSDACCRPIVDDVSVTDNWVMARHYVSHLTDTLWQTDAKVQTAVTVTNVVSIKRLLSRILSYVGNNVWRPTQNRFYGRHFPKCWPTWIKFVRNLLHGIHLMHIAKKHHSVFRKKDPLYFSFTPI